MQPLLEGVAAPHGQSGKPTASPLDHLRQRWPEWTALFVYAGLLALAIPYHEPFVDEAQSWQLARTLSLPALFQRYLRYEGSPGLWHFLNWILIRLHVSFSGLHWICGAIAVTATSLLIFRSPFPRYLKFTLPFTYFLIFQYAVIARNYVLAPLLLYTVALFWKKRPIFLAVALGLLANVALHAALLSGGLAIVYVIDHTRERSAKKIVPSREFLMSAGVLLAFYAFAIWTAWPPKDLLISRAVGGSHSFFVYAIASLVLGTCQPWLLSIPFWIAIALCFKARRSLHYLLPVLFFAVFSGAVCASFWHMGLLIPLLICLFWITWPASDQKASRSETIGRAALVLLAAVQISWSAYAVTYDRFHNYSPDPATAAFLRPFIQNGETIGLTYLTDPADNAFVDDPQDHDYMSVGLLPYFDRNIYANQLSPFWSWSNKNPTEALFDKVLSNRPRLVLVEVVKSKPGPVNLDNPKVKLLTNDGYRLTNMFCGSMPQRLELQLTSCHLIFQHQEKPL